MKKGRRPLTLSWRIGFPNSESDEAFVRLLSLLDDHPTVVDEVALFETVTHHLYVPLDILAERAKLLGRRVQALWGMGIPSVGINVLTTIGHLNEAWDTMPALPFQPMIGHDGSVSKGCACPNTPEFREYVRAKYTLFAEAEPDFIWVDDDLRMHHHGVTFGCFCPTCLTLFAQASGATHTRESLVHALNDPTQGALRCAWVEQNVRTLESLLSDVREAIRAVGPRIKTGLMTAGPGWTTYSGQAFGRWFPALGATKARPGGGFYSDANRLEAVGKAFEVGRQRASLPATVTDCQYELENFPYQTLRKSVGSVANECLLALAVGHNGIAFNALGMWGGSLDDYRPLLRRVAELRPMWEAAAEWAGGLPTEGLWPAWSRQLMARRQVRPGEDWFAHDRLYDTTRPYVLAELGVPLSTDRPGCGTILSGRVAEAFDDGELRTILTGGVLMDTAALDVLTSRGLDHLAGVRVARRIDNGAMERFTGDPLNGPHTGEVRDARIEFWGDARGMADTLEPLGPNVRFLAGIEDYFRRPVGPCMTAYENELGGRVAVMGYAPWMFIHSTAKREQLLNVADWVTAKTLPVRIEETVPLIPFVRMSRDRERGMVVLLNAGLDRIPRATIELRTPRVPVHILTPKGMTRAETYLSCLTLRRIEPWSTVCLLLGE